MSLGKQPFPYDLRRRIGTSEYSISKRTPDGGWKPLAHFELEAGVDPWEFTNALFQLAMKDGLRIARKLRMVERGTTNRQRGKK